MWPFSGTLSLNALLMHSKRLLATLEESSRFGRMILVQSTNCSLADGRRPCSEEQGCSGYGTGIQKKTRSRLSIGVVVICEFSLSVPGLWLSVVLVSELLMMYPQVLYYSASALILCLLQPLLFSLIFCSAKQSLQSSYRQHTVKLQPNYSQTTVQLQRIKPCAFADVAEPSPKWIWGPSSYS